MIGIGSAEVVRGAAAGSPPLGPVALLPPALMLAGSPQGLSVTVVVTTGLEGWEMCIG